VLFLLGELLIKDEGIIKMDSEDELFETRDFYLAAFLKVKNIKLVKAVKQGELLIFCFEKNDNLEELITNFYADSEDVSANRLINAIRDLKALKYNIKER